MKEIAAWWYLGQIAAVIGLFTIRHVTGSQPQTKVWSGPLFAAANYGGDSLERTQSFAKFRLESHGSIVWTRPASEREII